MYFTTGIYPWIAFIAIEIVFCSIIFALINTTIPWLIRNILTYVVFRLAVTTEEIRIHEAGHMVAFLKTCTDLKKRPFMHQAQKIKLMNQTQINGDVHIHTNSWNYRNKMLLPGGVAAELKLKGKRMNRFRYSIYFWFKGCRSDFTKLRFVYNMSKNQVIQRINQTIDNFTERDMEFIQYISDEFKKKSETGKWKKRTFSKEELFNLSIEYYESYKNTVNQ